MMAPGVAHGISVKAFGECQEARCADFAVVCKMVVFAYGKASDTGVSSWIGAGGASSDRFSILPPIWIEAAGRRSACRKGIQRLCF